LALENKIQKLSSDAIDLEWKKQQSQEIVITLNSSILLKKSLNSYNMMIELKNQIWADLDIKIEYYSRIDTYNHFSEYTDV
jgi:hypothetical protein